MSEHRTFPTIVATSFALSTHRALAVSLVAFFKQAPAVSLCVFKRHDGDPDSPPVPTQAHISIPLDRLPDVIEGLQHLQAMVDAAVPISETKQG